LSLRSRARSLFQWSPLFQWSLDTGSPCHLSLHCPSSASSLWISDPASSSFSSRGSCRWLHLIFRWLRRQVGFEAADRMRHTRAVGMQVGCEWTRTMLKASDVDGGAEREGDRRPECDTGGRREMSRECVTQGELYLWVAAPPRSRMGRLYECSIEDVFGGYSNIFRPHFEI
jgi:hypothetical protein